MTTDEYLRTPETRLPQELVYGFVRDAAAPTPGHQWAVGAIYRHLHRHLEQTRAGRVWLSPVDVVLDCERSLVVQPDVIVVLNERLRIVTDRVWGAPDLVVEVLSPRPRIGSLDERLAWFAEYGVRECWLARQLGSEIGVVSFAERSIRERRVSGPEQRVESIVLPALELTPGDVL